MSEKERTKLWSELTPMVRNLTEKVKTKTVVQSDVEKIRERLNTLGNTLIKDEKELRKETNHLFVRIFNLTAKVGQHAVDHMIEKIDKKTLALHREVTLYARTYETVIRISEAMHDC